MKIYLVGGAVRDELLGLPVKERDWVVVGATPADMSRLGYRQVGKEFPVFLHPKTGEEYALARMERKIGPGYKGFAFDTSPQVTLEEDLIRRDLTINAMAETPEGKLIDPYHGQQDLQNRWLRHVSSAFAEDPVRILRVARFAARYYALGFRIAPETMDLMRAMVASGEVNALVAERVWKELERALSEKNPEVFFQVLAECNALPILFPGLNAAGPGISALQAAVKITTDTSIRFAALLYAYPEGDSAKDPKKSITELSDRYRVPALFRELSLIAALYYSPVLGGHELSAEKILELLQKTDAFRREERFNKFLEVCVAIAYSQRKSFDLAWWKKIHEAAKLVDTEELVKAGLVGLDFAKQLQQQRLEKINAVFIKKR